jgi:hypothetical protein
MKPNFKKQDYPNTMLNFIEMWLDRYDYNSKALKISPFTLWWITIQDLMNTVAKKSKESILVRDLPDEDKIALVKCLGQRIGVWDLHVYYLNIYKTSNYIK